MAVPKAGREAKRGFELTQEVVEQSLKVQRLNASVSSLVMVSRMRRHGVSKSVAFLTVSAPVSRSWHRHRARAACVRAGGVVYGVYVCVS